MTVAVDPAPRSEGAAPTAPVRAPQRRMHHSRPVLKLYVPRARGAGVEHWEQWWAKEDPQQLLAGFAADPLLGIMQQRMSSTAPILEAGCGPGYLVQLMREAGYAMVGLDFARGESEHP